MANPLYVQNFDGLSTGALSGQDSWNGSVGPLVTALQSFTSPNSVIVTGSGSNNRDCTAQTSGTQFYAVYCGTMGSSGDGLPGRLMSEGTSGKIYNKWQNVASALIFQNINGGSYANMFTGATGNWYVVRIDFDNSTDTYTYQWKISGGTFSSTSGAQSYLSGATNLDRTYLEQDATWVSYVDSYSATDPTPAAGPANVKTWNGLALASVKTVNGLALASIKTIDGLN